LVGRGGTMSASQGNTIDCNVTDSVNRAKRKW
jgi:hypothetical protein